MSSTKHAGLVALALVVGMAAESAAQRTPQRPATQRPAAQRPAAAAVEGSWELGMDMDVGIGFSDPMSFFIDIPAGVVRAGYYVSDVLSLEPALAFNSVAQKSATGFSRWMLQFGALYHLSPARTRSQLFVHPAIGFSGGSGGARTLTHLSGGVGMKRPMLGGRLASRMELGLNHRVKSGPIDSETSLIGFLGWSFYTR